MYGQIKTNFEALGIKLPASIVKAARVHEQASDHARQIREEAPPVFDPAVLAGEDWFEALQVEAARLASAPLVDRVAREAVGALGRQVEAVCATEKKRLLDLLQGWFVEHVEDFARVGDPSLGVARRDEIEEQRRTFELAHRALLGGSIGHAGTSIEGAWALMHFSMGSAAWQRLIEQTRPGRELYRDQDVYQLCLEVGGVPRLASSWQQADDEALELWRARKAGQRIDAADQARAQSTLALAASVLGADGEEN